MDVDQLLIMAQVTNKLEHIQECMAEQKVLKLEGREREQKEEEEKGENKGVEEREKKGRRTKGEREVRDGKRNA